jgi:hypothetical protein
MQKLNLVFVRKDKNTTKYSVKHAQVLILQDK